MARKRKESSAADRDEAGPRKKQGGAKGSNQREAGLGTDDTPPPHATPPPPPKVATLQQLSKAETEYLRWLTSRGVKLNGVSIGRFPRTGRGCVATRDIAPGEVVIEVPDDEVITADGSVAGNALTAFGICGDALSENPSPRLQREALVLAVMAEMSRGAESTFAAYLNALPRLRATHSPLAWSAEELFELQGTSTMDDMLWTADQELELPSMVADHWKHVAEPFLRENPEFARAPGADEDEDIDMEEAKKMYLHATALVACFSFTLGGDDECGHDHGTTTQAMVPFWDMLNHREPAAASVTLNHDPETGMLQMIAVKPVRAGAEVFNTYGAAGDSELLRRYGFVMRRNPHGGGSTVGVRELMAAAAMARYTADREDEEMRQQGGSLEDDADNNSDDDDDDDFGPPPPFSDSEEEQEDDDDDEEEKEEEEEEEVSDEDEDGEDTNLGLGEISRSDILERLRWLRRQGILSDSQERFSVSRTGRPSLALRYAARVLSMHSFQFKRLLAADAYERGDRADQTGAYSDDEDEDEDTFGGFKPLTVEQVWNGVSGAGEEFSRVFHARA